MPAFDFAGARLFEPFGRTFVSLQLWHKKIFWVVPVYRLLATDSLIVA